MFVLFVFVFLCAVGLHGCSHQENFNELLCAWECDTVCVGSGGKPAFDLKNKICKCTLDDNADDIDKQVILKNSGRLEAPLSVTKNVIKRQTSSDLRENLTVGQRAPSRMASLLRTTRRPFHLPTHRSFSAPLHRGPAPRVVDSRLREIQKRIDDLRQSRTRNRAGPHLQQRAGFPDESQPNLMERLRQMQKETQEKLKSRTATLTTALPNVAAPAPRINAATTRSSGIVGATRNVTNKNDKGTNAERSDNTKKSDYEVITQDPSLYDKVD